MKCTITILVAIAFAMVPVQSSASNTRCDKNHPRECHKLVKKVKRLEKAIAWQKKDAQHDVQKMLEQTRGTQPYAYAAKLAYLACVAFRGMGNPDCRPPSEQLKVGRCESGLQLNDPNPTSTASNFMQYLDSTWANAPAGQLGFYKLDVLAVAIQSEAKATSGWHEWRASIGCHHLT